MNSPPNELAGRVAAHAPPLARELAAPLSAETGACGRCPTPADQSGTWRTTWFFQRPWCCDRATSYRPFDERFGRLFSSYGPGPAPPRPQRGHAHAACWPSARHRAAVDAALLPSCRTETRCSTL